MSEPSPPRRRRWRQYLLGFFVFCLIGFGILGWYVKTDSFHRLVRRHLVQSLEDATGGRVEIGDFHTIPLRLRVDVQDLTIHGREAADQAPYLHVDHLRAELKIVSLFEKEIGLHSLVVEHPVVHIIVYPDGSTNQPKPKIASTSRKTPVEHLFSLSASRVDVEKGELLWALNKIPLDFHAHDLSLALTYSFLRQRYEARLVLGNVATRMQEYPAFDWRADASVVLYRDHANISALTVSSGKSQVHFSGDVRDFQNQQVSGTYRGTVDLAEWASLLKEHAIRKGTASFDGKGSWSVRDFSTDGTLIVKDFDWLDGRVNFQNARMSTNYSVTPLRFRLSSLKMNGMGGELAGEVDVTNWQTSLEAPRQRHVIGRVPAGSLQRGSVRLQLAGSSLSPLIQALSSKDLPLDRLRMTGVANGSIEMLWVGSIRDAETRMDLTFSPPPRTQPGDLLVRGEVKGIYRGSRGELQLDQFRLNTPASEINAKGNLAATSALGFSFSSHNLKEWDPLLKAAFGQNPPFSVAGWANLSGNASGKLSAFLLNGNLEVYDFATTLPASAHRPANSVHWDSLTAAVQYSNNNLSARNGSLVHGHTVIHFDASTGLIKGVPAENTAFTARFDVRNADLAELEQVMGFSYPVTGTLNLTAHASGSRANPHGEGRLEIRDASAYRTPIPFLRSDLRLADGELQFNNLETRLYGAPITGSTAVSLSGDACHVSLAAHDLNFASFPNLQGTRITVDGRADFTVQGAGTLERPSLQAHIHLRDLFFDKERAGDFYVDAVTEGDQLAIQAHSEFEKADLRVTGSVGMKNDFSADLDLTFQDLDIDSLLKAYLGDRVTSHSMLGGTVKLRGPLRRPRDLTLSAALDNFSAELQHVQVRNAEPIRLELADRVVRLESFHISGSGTDFTAHGLAQLTEPRQIEFRLEGTANMALLQTINPKMFARGMVNLDLTASGTLAQPQLQGQLGVKDGYISHNDFPSGLSGLNGVLRFEQNRIRIEQLTGTTGGGTVALTGAASFQGGVLNMDLTAVARDVRLRYPPGVSSTANANLRLTGTSNSALLSGEVVVTKLSVTPGFDFGAYLQKSKQSVVAATSDTLESHVKLDVHIITTPELQMQSAMARLSGNADLRLRGSADRPVVMGRAGDLEGEISFNGTKYRMERGEVTFTNPARTEAHIDLQATTRVRDYDITVRIYGDATKPNGLTAKWQSDPPLPEADVIALLALGRTTEEAAALQSSSTSGLTGEASNLILSQALNSAVGSRVQRLFGVSRIKIDPQGLASTTNVVRGPQVTIEHQVANNITVTYSTNVSVASQQIIQVEYNVSRNVSVVALRDQNGVVSFDIKIRQRKK